MISGSQQEETPSPKAFVGAQADFCRCLDKLPVGAYICDVDGKITYCNPAAVKMWGRQPRLHSASDRFCGSLKLFDVEGKPIRHEDCWTGLALRNGREYAGEEVVVERPDGSRLTLLAHATPIRNDEGDIIGVVNVMVDIHEREKAAEATRAAHEAAAALNRAKDQFLAALSHELRTPLSPVTMTLAAMEADPDLPLKFREDVTLMRRNIELESKLIDDLLDVSRVISGKLNLEPRQLRMHAKLRHVIQNSVSDLNRKKLHIHTTFAAANDHVNADAARLQQVLWNLLRNATKFTPDGGEITVRTWNEKQGTELYVEVRDTGIGIEPDVLTRIFNPFEQGNPGVTRQFGGMGLGLAIARSIVEMHGGSISVASEGLGKGATFVLRLPTIPTPTDAPDPVEPGGNHPVRTTRARVLLVEDHADTASVLKRLLSRSGYEVKVATSAAMALQLSACEEFDVMVSDIGLPDATGYELLAQLRKEKETIKAIAMSGYGMEDDVQRSREAGFLEHLIKPVHVRQLEAALHKVVTGQATTHVDIIAQ